MISWASWSTIGFTRSGKAWRVISCTVSLISTFSSAMARSTKPGNMTFSDSSVCGLIRSGKVSVIIFEPGDMLIRARRVRRVVERAREDRRPGIEGF